MRRRERSAVLGKNSRSAVRDTASLHACQAEVRARFLDCIGGLPETRAASLPRLTGRENQRIRFIVWDMLGCMPGLSDEHCAEFYYQTTGNQENRDRFGMHYDRIEDRQNSFTRLREQITIPLETGNMPALHISDEKPDRVIEALEGGRPFYDVMNYRNLGQVRELPIDHVVETFVNVDATGVHPAIASPLSLAAQNIVIPTALREEMFMEAAVDWDVAKLTAALCTDPLVNDFTRVRAVVKELMDYNAQFLPKNWI